ncbi:hypothetical protein V1514DRAFT_317423 [Lipomyces japonicus]|uniref:uncharacterized protein n=1 Tax=Lipomyces japonicus TaxID=56871 RepID=UPI0034CFC57C
MEIPSSVMQSQPVTIGQHHGSFSLSHGSSPTEPDEMRTPLTSPSRASTPVSFTQNLGRPTSFSLEYVQRPHHHHQHHHRRHHHHRHHHKYHNYNHQEQQRPTHIFFPSQTELRQPWPSPSTEELSVQLASHGDSANFANTPSPSSMQFLQFDFESQPQQVLPPSLDILVEAAKRAEIEILTMDISEMEF